MTTGHNQFGGSWTEDKLTILEGYLDAYTTALKNQAFELVYLDAFAGTGWIESGNEDDYGIPIMGSADRALSVRYRSFDRVVLVDHDSEKCHHLRELRHHYPGRVIDVQCEDANGFLRRLHRGTYGKAWRGVLFLDPFGVQLEWSTVEHIAGLQKLDMWLLFPASAIGRMLPLSKDPDAVTPQWVNRLNAVFGNDSWRRLYSPSAQRNLFGMEEVHRDRGVDGLRSIYESQLQGLFGNRFLGLSRTLKNRKNSPLFELFFCVGSPSPQAIGIAKRIATHKIRS